MLRKIFFYLILVSLFAGGVALILKVGGPLSAHSAHAAIQPATSYSAFEGLNHSPALILLRLLIIIPSALGFGFLFKKLGQPSVMGEMVAGILIGPSFLGWIFPDFFHFVFPSASLGYLQILSQIGILFFMFIVGMEMDLPALKKEIHSAVVISHSSMMAPFLLGMVLALYLFKSCAPAGISFPEFSLFMGIAMSITAFPVLARIVREKGLAGTRLGTMALTCAAVEDVTAWSLLAVIVAIAQSASLSAALNTVSLTLGFAAAMIFIVKPFLARFPQNRSRLSFLLLMSGSAWITEQIGIHGLFGAFLAGVIVPKDLSLRNFLSEPLEKISVFLMPIFFALTGLRMHGELLSWSGGSLRVFFLILAVAVAGKFGGSFFAARFSRMSVKDSAVIGILMNTRGLMELVVLNLGYDMGILSNEIFTLMVLMTLVTTLAAGPLLQGLERFRTKNI